MKPGKYIAILVENKDGTSTVTFFPEAEKAEAAQWFGAAMSALSFVEFTTATVATVHPDGSVEMRVSVNV